MMENNPLSAARGGIGRWSMLALVMLLLLLAACSAVPPAQTDEQRIAERAKERWDALIDARLEAAFGYETPAYRKAHALRMYRARFGSAVTFTSAEVTRVEVEGDRARVMVLVGYATVSPSGDVLRIDRPVREVWVRSGDEWWHSIQSR